MVRTLIVLVSLVHFGSVPAQVLRSATDVRTSSFGQPRWSDDGSLLFVAGAADLVGSNPDHHWQIFRFEPATGTADQLTTLPRGIQAGTWSFAVSDDGSVLAFTSRDDPLGSNPDHSVEVFAMHADGTGLTQVTQSVGAGTIDRVEISGDGSRLVFDATFDYTGGNPDGRLQVFTVAGDGTGMLQLTAGNTGGFLPSISDDGLRVVYIDGGTYTLWGVESDGTDLRQLTTWITFAPVISGDGGTVIFLLTGSLPNELPTWCFGGVQVGAVDWDGSDAIKLSGNCLGGALSGSVTSIGVTDDGQTIYHAGRDRLHTVRSIPRDASAETGLIPVTDWNEENCGLVGVAGDGSRFAVTCEGLDLVGANPDLSLELFSADPAGQDQVQHTTTGEAGGSQRAGISADGNWMFFSSDANPLDEPTHPGGQLYRVRTDGTDLQRLSELTRGEILLPRVTGDGSLAVFETNEPFIDATSELWVADAATGMSTRIDGYFTDPDIDDAGTWIVARRSGSIYRMRTDGSEQLELAPSALHLRISGNAAFIAFTSSGPAVYRMTIDGTNQRRLADGIEPEMSRDGSRVVFASNDDPLGGNADGNDEIFLAEIVGHHTVLLQLTDTTSVDNRKPSISGDGSTVYYLERISGFPTLVNVAWRVDVATLAAERVTALAPCVVDEEGPLPIGTDLGGSLAVFAASDDCVGDNPDQSSEILLADYEASPRLLATASQPTRLEWDVSPGVDRYDLIRGQVGALAFSGAQVDLGDVECLVDDLPFNSNLGREDAFLPAVGEAEFYLVRGTFEVGYGSASDGRPRMPSFGDCP